MWAGGLGEPLVFLHGIGGNRTNWAAQLAGLSDRWRCIAFDFRGYGDSEDVGLARFLRFLRGRHARARRAEVPRCHLFGLSMGGLVAQAFYARNRGR